MTGNRNLADVKGTSRSQSFRFAIGGGRAGDTQSGLVTSSGLTVPAEQLAVHRGIAETMWRDWDPVAHGLPVRITSVMGSCRSISDAHVGRRGETALAVTGQTGYISSALFFESRGVVCDSSLWFQ